MAVYTFGSGTVIGRRTDISNPTPLFMGALQDVQIDIDQSLKELTGQYKLAVDVAPSALKVTGKCKQARIQANLFNDMILGGTLTTGAGISMAIAEAFTTATTTYTAANAANYVEDLGLFYAASGKQLVRVATGPTVGQYSVNETTGIYTISTADENTALLLYYNFNVTTQKQITMTNQFMGIGPSFEIMLSNTYVNNAGLSNTTFLKLYACRSNKMSMMFKNTDYLIPEFDFQAFANAAGQWGTWASTE